jgi:hypothetical protein
MFFVKIQAFLFGKPASARRAKKKAFGGYILLIKQVPANYAHFQGIKDGRLNIF